MNVSAVETSAQRIWELAEVERSAYEAEHTTDDSLRADPRNLARYLNPPRDTAFPLEYAFSLLGDISGQTVVDFGCGSGENTLPLLRRGAHVVAVDLSPHLLRVAQRRLSLNGERGRAQFVVGSAHDLPVASGAADIVLGIAILHHLDLAAAAREVHRVLRPGGRAIFQEPVRDSTLIKSLRAMVPYRAPDVSPFERPLTSRELAEFSSRFSSCSLRAFSLPFVNLTQVVPALQSKVHAAYRLDRAILARVPALAHYAGVRVLELTK